MFRSQDHLQGATLFLAEVTYSRNMTHDTHPQSGAFSAAYYLHNTTCCHSTELI